MLFKNLSSSLFFCSCFYFLIPSLFPASSSSCTSFSSYLIKQEFHFPAVFHSSFDSVFVQCCPENFLWHSLFNWIIFAMHSSRTIALCLSLLIPRSLSRCTHSVLDSSAAIGFLSKSFCLGQNALMQLRPPTPLLDISSSPRLTHIINHSYAILFMPLDKTPSQARLFAPMPTANRV